MKDIRRRYNPMVDLSKFTFNKKILNKIIATQLSFGIIVTKKHQMRIVF